MILSHLRLYDLLIYVVSTREIIQCVILLRKSEPNFGKAPQLPATH